MTLVNRGRQADRLVGASSPVAARAQLHAHQMEGNVMKMRPLGAVEVAPGSPTVLAPGGIHVMLMGLKGPLVEGTAFSLELRFEHAGRMEVEVQVLAPGAMGPAPGKAHDMKGHGS